MISADKIVEERKRLNLSQEELAEKLSVSRQAVSKWESSQSTPDLQKIIERNRADFTFCAVPFAYTYMDRRGARRSAENAVGALHACDDGPELAVFLRRKSLLRLEKTGEIADVFNAALLGYLPDGHMRRAHKLLCVGHTQIYEVLRGRLPEVALELLLKIARIHGKKRAETVKRDLTAEIFLQI